MTYLIPFIEGFLTFLSPCLLPMLPLYISYFGGQKKAFFKSFFFVLGFSLVFVSLGALAGSLGRFLMEYRRIIEIVSGLFIILFALHFLGFFFLPFFRGRDAQMDLKGLNHWKAFLFGIFFSLAWSPCVGPFLASALMLANQKGSQLQGIFMLLSYSLGIGLPFLLSALLLDQLKEAFDFLKKNMDKIQKISGLFLLLLGFLVLSGYYNQILGNVLS